MNELYHHGIRGQRWGVRRYQNPDGTLTNAGKKRIAKDVNSLKENGPKAIKKTGKFIGKHRAEIQAYKENSKNIKNMSNKQIRDRINRIKMEQQLREMEKPAIVRGANTVGKILKNSSTAAATTVATSVTIWAVKKAIEKEFGIDIAKDIFPKKK